MNRLKLQIGDRVLIKDGSSSCRNWIFKPYPIKVKISDLDSEGFHAIFDDEDETKVIVRKWMTNPFWYHFDEIVKLIPKRESDFNPSRR